LYKQPACPAAQSPRRLLPKPAAEQRKSRQEMAYGFYKEASGYSARLFWHVPAPARQTPPSPDKDRRKFAGPHREGTLGAAEKVSGWLVL
jgi:hypothetical protein